jgi:hypothetical protein
MVGLLAGVGLGVHIISGFHPGGKPKTKALREIASDLSETLKNQTEFV